MMVEQVSLAYPRFWCPIYGVLCKIIKSIFDNPTYVIITDRNDLDEQLYGQFSRVKEFLRQTPVQASSRENLRQL